MVSLAKRLEKAPFHLVASHCQRDSRGNVVRYLQSKGLPEDTLNFTATSFGRHPKVKGNGYVPYYAVFDHHGKLIYHHMCGDYHGGDGLRMIEWVDQLLKDAPLLYLGAEPFQINTKLARDIASKKSLARNLLQVEKRRADEDEDPSSRAELQRLYARIEEYRDRQLRRVQALLAHRPAEVIAKLQNLAAELGKAELGSPVRSQIDSLQQSEDLRDAIALQKEFAKALAKIEQLRSRKGSERSIAKIQQSLRDQVEGVSLPIADTIREFLDPAH